MASIISAGTTSGTSLNLSGDTSGVLQLASNGSTTAVTIDTSQNVGIGTTSPAAPADVVSNSNAIAVSMRGRVSDDACVIRWISNNGSTVNGRIQVNSGGDMIFQNTNSITERMRIASDGAISAGSTTSTVGCGVWSNYGSRIVDFARYADDGNIVGFKRGATLVGNISVTGSATAYNTSSDYRLKENIEPMTGALAVVGQLKPCTYTWKADGSNGQGFIAHELAEVVPQAVTGEKDALDKDGNPEYQGIDVSFLVATLTAAIQELNAKVEAQAVRIAELEGAK